MEATERRRETRLRFGSDEEYAWGWLIDHPQEAQALFARHHGTSPLCLCTPDGVPIHITRGSSHLFLARNPNTGHRHAWYCRFYSDADNEWAVAREGVQAEAVDDRVAVNTPGLVPPAAPSAVAPTAPPAINDDAVIDASCFPLGGNQPADMSAAGAALENLLARLWQMARFHRYTPAMAGKRGYWTVHRHLPLVAAELLLPNGQASLASMLFMPAPYRGREHRDEHHETVTRSLWEAERAAGGAFLVSGEVRDVVATEYGYALHLKHLPYKDLTLFLSRQVAERDIPGMLDTTTPAAGRRWVMASVARSGRGNLRALAVGMLQSTEDLIPIAGDAEMALADALVRAGRRFARLTPNDTGSTFLLFDAGAERGMPLKIVAAHSGRGWEWAYPDEPLPALPPFTTREDIAR